MFEITITPVKESPSYVGGYLTTGEEVKFTVPDVFVSWLEKSLDLEKSDDENLTYRIIRNGAVVDYTLIKD